MRRRLTLTVLAVTAMVTVAYLVPLGAAVRVVAEDQALSVADQEARSLASVFASDPTPAALAAVVDQLNSSGGGRMVEVYEPSGGRVGATAAVPSDELALAREGRAFTSASGGQTRVWVPVRLASGTEVGVVIVPGRLLHQGVARAWLVLGLVGLSVVVLALVLADRLGRSMVRAIEALGSVTRRLRQGELSARVDPAGPEEIASVGRAVNELADRIIELLAIERERSADVSHRLRTPLAALKLEAEGLSEPAERQRVNAVVNDLTQEVTQVISELRQGVSARAPESSDLAAAVRSRLEFWSVLADEQNRTWSASIPAAPVPVAVSGTELAAAVDALIGNVLAHTPDGTGFRVSVLAADHEAVLVVEDDGPGFPSEPVRGRSGSGSTGLGIDIARRTAQRTGGTLRTGASATGGARVDMVFATGAVASPHPPTSAQGDEDVGGRRPGPVPGGGF